MDNSYFVYLNEQNPDSTSISQTTIYDFTSIIETTTIIKTTQIINSTNIGETFSDIETINIIKSTNINNSTEISESTVSETSYTTESSEIYSSEILTSVYTNQNYINNSSSPIVEEIDIVKDKIMDNLDFIIKNITIGQTYIKKNEEYSIIIYPTNSTYLTQITHVNFSECEAVLRNHYNIPDESILTFLQIELKNGDSKSLINQV